MQELSDRVVRASSLSRTSTAGCKASPTLFRPEWARTATQSAPEGGKFSFGESSITGDFWTPGTRD